MEPTIVHKGLDNIYVKESKVCFVDGNRSRLYYRGYPIENLAANSTFEEVAYLLLFGELPTKNELTQFDSTLKLNRELDDTTKKVIHDTPVTAHPMDALRTAVSALGSTEKQTLHTDLETNRKDLIRILATAPTMTALFHRIRTHQKPIDPTSELGHGANFLCMLTGTKPSEEDARIFDMALVLHAEHDVNASTFSCMVTASTLADMYSVICAGIGTLRGPLHGGANEAALNTFLEVGSPDNAVAFVEKTLAARRRVMGFGHRIYRNFDPRYVVLKEEARSLAKRKGRAALFDTAEAIEKAALERLSDSSIFPNVDFYSGIVFHLLDIPTDLFTPVFAISRIAGWSAHTLEYLESNRLIRPKSVYTGELDREYVPIERRGT
jgi:citrate synthase